MKFLCITQARFNSSRFPGKALAKIGGKTVLQIHLERILKATKISKLLVATTLEPESDQILQVCRDLGVDYFQGSLDDVLDRFYQAAKPYQPEFIIRLTSDCPLIDPLLIDETIVAFSQDKFDYFSNGFLETFPDGQDIEITKFEALEKAWKNSKLMSEREHVTPYIWKNSTLHWQGQGQALFKAGDLRSPISYKHVRMTVDYPSDLEVIQALIEKLGEDRSWKEYAEYLSKNHSIASLNSEIIRNEGYQTSLKKDEKQEDEK